jgi:hypothetical protein
MAKKPDLGDMMMPKAAAAATMPFGEPNPAPDTSVPKGLTIKLDGTLYAALRQYCHQKEMARGSRVTHQEVVVAALKAFLAANG